MILCGLVWLSIVYSSNVFPCKVSNGLVWLCMVLYGLTQLCTIFVLVPLFPIFSSIPSGDSKELHGAKECQWVTKEVKGGCR